ncbi:MAG: aminotransferase class I/II-fold pyridoxal phosphate-dependent enzyme [Thermoguttaceae bacterium]
MMFKRSVFDLAVCGGKSAFCDPLHVGRPNIGDRDRLVKRLVDILDRRVLTNNGPYVRQFEECIAELLGVKYCVATCNATVALQLAVRALNLSGEVILPSFTFIATAHALAWEGITPVFCDVGIDTHTLDSEQVQSLITDNTSAILGVHLWGRPCDIPALTKIAGESNLRLFFDAAHALGCSFNGKMLGNFGDLEVLSFHATKVLNSFEGGALVTNDESLVPELRLARNFGFNGFDDVTALGINAKMCEMSAAMGLTSLESLDLFCARNQSNYELYNQHLQDIPGISLCQYDRSERHNFHYIVLECNGDDRTLTRNELLAVLHMENVLARRYFYPGCHQMEPYRSMCPSAVFRLRNTRRLADRLLILPNGTTICEEHIRVISDILRLAQANVSRIRGAMGTSARSGRLAA